MQFYYKFTLPPHRYYGSVVMFGCLIMCECENVSPVTDIDTIDIVDASTLYNQIILSYY